MGGADVGRTVWRVADNLEKTLLCTFLFSWAKFFKLDTVFPRLEVAGKHCIRGRILFEGAVYSFQPLGY